MLVKNGKNRFVVIFPSLGIAVKFPIVHFVRAGQQFFRQGFSNPYPGDVSRSLTEHLFKGMADNWHEFTFYIKTRHPFCQPTFFSLFGLFNIQRAGIPCGRSMQALWQEINEVTAGQAFKDAHHFCNPLNFCHAGQQFKIMDYGHLITQKIISTYGEQLRHCQHGLCLPTPEMNQQ